MSAEALLTWRRRCLAEGGRPADFDWLLDVGSGLPWTQLQRLRLDPSAPVRLNRAPAQIEQLWHRHLQTAEPLQYLVGLCPWRDVDLQVGPGVLIPRQETELLVDLALELCSRPPALWADLGTGSGCLAVALARLWPEAQGLAVDLSAEALNQAGTNLQAFERAGQVRLLQGSWWEPLKPWRGSVQLALANPPYIPTAVWTDLEPVVRDHEPRLALEAGSDGLDAIRAVVAGAATGLAPGGLLLLEHHHDQSERVSCLLAAAGLIEVQAHRDLENVNRFASARRPPSSTP
ncbi:modification methylase, HemK family [Cyanobium sp. PCC 7001]|uniref:peptide chain release factor N(5)-glutamine methyltransferase n=1 Tax=Cyanobium sp. PCC 7001 TaxID=180281 RepID=UPI00018052EC|nr:peptide chain release factor N(5)-glutamine methyltransferase [Cyanobium sp. PCC 7001]EDY38503.1 modification methylase, HemK family [Cyanobium sp. PCC 7001]